MHLLQNNPIACCQLWVGWSSLNATEQKGSVVHVLHSSRRKLYGRDPLKTVALLQKYFNVWIPAVSTWQKTDTQARLISKIYVTIWSTRKFAVAFKGTSSTTHPWTQSSGNTVLLETTDMSKHKAEITTFKNLCSILQCCSNIKSLGPFKEYGYRHP